MRRLIAAGAAVATLAATARGAAPVTHRLEATPATIAYGYYDAAAAPVLRIASGDIIDVDTLLTNTPAGLQRAGVAADRIQASLTRIVEQTPPEKKGPGGHILTGPVFVDGAEPGDALEVKILSVDLAIPYGYNGCSGFVRENCTQGPGRTRIIELNAQTMTAEFAPGIVIPLRPFFGSMGVAPPPAAGRISSNPPGIHAGNLDNRSLVAGTTLFIPVHAPGALFEVGDGHAAQGDGEVDQTAIETSLRGRLQLTVRKGMTLAWPRAETPTEYISMGTDEDLTKATSIAIQQMIDFLVAEKKLGKMAAYQLTSIAGDVHVTQLVDGKVGVHVSMPKGIFR
jgi:acetamidase/formamidase